MSCPHVVWALRQRGLSAPERVVLIYLADKARAPEMVCWPSIDTIAEATELAEKTVRRAVLRLADLRLIRIEARRRHTHHYHILRPRNGLDGDPMQPESGNGGHVDRSDLPANASVDRSEIPPNEIERSDLPVNVTDQLPLERSESPPNPPNPKSWPVSVGPYPPKKESTLMGNTGGRAGARRHPTPLPDAWQPSVAACDLGHSLGLSQADVAMAADRMRDWSIGDGKLKADWDATFRNWLRKDASEPRRRPEHAMSKHEQIRRAGNLGTFLGPMPRDDLPEQSFLRLVAT